MAMKLNHGHIIGFPCVANPWKLTRLWAMKLLFPWKCPEIVHVYSMIKPWTLLPWNTHEMSEILLTVKDPWNSHVNWGAWNPMKLSMKFPWYFLGHSHAFGTWNTHELINEIPMKYPLIIFCNCRMLRTLKTHELKWNSHEIYTHDV